MSRIRHTTKISAVAALVLALSSAIGTTVAFADAGSDSTPAPSAPADTSVAPDNWFPGAQPANWFPGASADTGPDNWFPNAVPANWFPTASAVSPDNWFPGAVPVNWFPSAVAVSPDNWFPNAVPAGNWFPNIAPTDVTVSSLSV
ncbi:MULTISPECIES: hypothetical protein [unclassified Streptomyces]|uniref:hypothetical protein n=1 Tax=unclassified Streptomyces TaxID=2593676 RepID=UPI0033BA14C6